MNELDNNDNFIGTVILWFDYQPHQLQPQYTRHWSECATWMCSWIKRLMRRLKAILQKLQLYISSSPPHNLFFFYETFSSIVLILHASTSCNWSESANYPEIIIFFTLQTKWTTSFGSSKFWSFRLDLSLKNFSHLLFWNNLKSQKVPTKPCGFDSKEP